MKLLIIILLFLSFSIQAQENPFAIFRERTEQFVSNNKEAARDAEKVYHVPASVLMALAIISTNGGQTNLSRKLHNQFGIICKKDKKVGFHCEKCFTDKPHYLLYSSNYWCFQDEAKKLSAEKTNYKGDWFSLINSKDSKKDPKLMKQMVHDYSLKTINL